VATERALKALYRSAFIAGAALGGGPPAAAAATAFLETDLGKAGIDNVTTWTTSTRKSSTSNKKSSSKPRAINAYNAKYSKAFGQVEKKYKKKNGSWVKDGFKKAQKAAHAKAGKMK